MLPILRIIPVGGVLLAIAITVLALSAPEGARSRLARVEAPARGPLVDRETHPEWRQFLIQAALRRASELERLRERPDTPARSEPKPDSDESPQPATEAEPPLVDEPAAVVEEHADAGASQSEPPVAPLPAAPVLPVEGGEIAALQEPAAPDVLAFVTPSASSEPTRVAILFDGVAPAKRSDTVALRVPPVADDGPTTPASPLKLEQVTASHENAVLPIERGVIANAQVLSDADDAVPLIESHNIAATQQPLTAVNTAADSTSKPKPTEVALLRDHVGPPVEGSDIVATKRPDVSGNASFDPSTQPKSTEVAPTLDKVNLPIEGSDPAPANVAALTLEGDTGAAEDETGAVGGPEDGSPDAVESDEATISRMPVVLPRERPPGIAEPRRKRRAVRRHVRRTRQARPVRTATNAPATYNFFDALLRMLGANAPPPNSAMSRRMTRPLY